MGGSSLRKVFGWGVVLLAFGLVLSASEVALAESDPHDGEIDRWVFSTGLEVGVFAHTGKGSNTATSTGCPRVDVTRPSRGVVCDGPFLVDYQRGDQRSPNVVPDQGSREDILSALVGGNFEIMSPALADVPTRPRLFFDVNVSVPLTTEVGLAREADPDELRFPDIIETSQVLGELATAGRGTKITVQHQGPQFHAGLGAALTFDFGPERIRIKPSLVYSRIIMDISATTRRAVRLGGFDPTNRDFDSEFRKIELDDLVTEVYHGIGPALEVEYETRNRIGPFSLSIFVKGHASHLFGDLETEMSGTNSDPGVFQFNDAGEQIPIDETVNWRYNQDRWVFRASTGLRFRLVPKKRR